MVWMGKTVMYMVRMWRFKGRHKMTATEARPVDSERIWINHHFYATVEGVMFGFGHGG